MLSMKQISNWYNAQICAVCVIFLCLCSVQLGLLPLNQDCLFENRVRIVPDAHWTTVNLYTLTKYQ